MAVGTHKGFVQIWDAAAGKKLSMLEGHTARVGGEPRVPAGGMVPAGERGPQHPLAPRGQASASPRPLPGLQGHWPGTRSSCHPGAGTA